MLSASRRMAAVAVILIILSLVIAYHAEYSGGVLPCPLCLLQRYLFIAIGLLFLFAWLVNPGRSIRVVLGVVLFVFSLAGAVLGARQLFLQMQPPSGGAACLPGLQYLFQTMHWTEALSTIFRGSAECGVVHWRLLVWAWLFGRFVCLCC